MTDDLGVSAPETSLPESTAPEVPASPSVEPALTEPEPTTEEKIEEGLQAVWNKHNPLRGEDGKFTPKEPGETVSPDQAPTKDAEPQKPAAIDMPQSWSADRKATWDLLPSAAKEIIQQREQEAHKAISRMGEQVKAYEPLGEVIEQYRDQFERAGIDEATGIARLLNASQRLDENPVAAIKWLANAYKVDLRQAAGLQAAESNTSPEWAGLIEQNRVLASQLAELRNRIDGREKVETETRLSATENQIAEFAKDKTDWADLENDILGEIYGLKAAIAAGTKAEMEPQTLLKTAYERAQRNNPDAWKRKQDAERQADEKKRIAEAQKRTLDARKGQVLNVKSSVANKPVTTTIDQELAQIARKAYG